MAANRAALEAISALALRRRDGTSTRWAGVSVEPAAFPVGPAVRRGHSG